MALRSNRPSADRVPHGRLGPIVVGHADAVWAVLLVPFAAVSLRHLWRLAHDGPA